MNEINIKNAYKNLVEKYLSEEDYMRGVKYYFSEDP